MSEEIKPKKAVVKKIHKLKKVDTPKEKKTVLKMFTILEPIATTTQTHKLAYVHMHYCIIMQTDMKCKSNEGKHINCIYIV